MQKFFSSKEERVASVLRAMVYDLDKQQEETGEISEKQFLACDFFRLLCPRLEHGDSFDAAMAHLETFIHDGRYPEAWLKRHIRGVRGIYDATA